MEIPDKISKWDWPDKITVGCGYDDTTEPDLTRDNFAFLAIKYNQLIDYITEHKGE